MSSCTRKPTICICETKGADQLCSNCTADQHLCFRYRDSTIPPLFIPKILAFFCDCADRFVSDLVGTKIVSFLTYRLRLKSLRLVFMFYVPLNSKCYMEEGSFERLKKPEIGVEFLHYLCILLIYEPPHEKLDNLHRRKQRRRSASR